MSRLVFGFKDVPAYSSRQNFANRSMLRSKPSHKELT